VSVASITLHLRAEETRGVLQKNNVPAHRIAVGALDTISRLKFDEPSQVKLGVLAAQHEPTIDRLKQVTARLSKAKTAPERARVVKEFEKELVVEQHSIAKPSANGNGHASRVPLRPRRDRLVRMLTQLVHFLEEGNVGEPFTTLDQL